MNTMRLFTASWCKPCSTVKDYIAERNITDIEIVDIETEQGDKTRRELGIRGIPILEKDDGTLLPDSPEIIKFLGAQYAA